MYVIFDIDGTLADNSHRKHLLKDGWDVFFNACHQDIPKTNVCALAKTLDRAGHKVEFWTGRPESIREKTSEWLEKYTQIGISKLNLLMRPNDSFVSNSTLKYGMLMNAVVSPDLVFEDSQEICDMFESQGVTALKAVSTKTEKYAAILAEKERK
jgi:phosphoglycolate phosphatase-like HAD superfamily hydrolase